MRDELFRILNKKGWEDEDLEDLQIILGEESGDLLRNVRPDIVELAFKELAFGKGSVKSRAERAARILNVSPESFRGFFEVLKGKRKSGRDDGVPFSDLIDRATGLKPWKIYPDFLEDLKVGVELSKSFELELSLRVHPYLYKVVTSRKFKPLILDGSNFLWKHDLCVEVFNDLFLVLADMSKAFYPVYMVFDANVEYIVPRNEKRFLSDILSSRFSYKHSPADELIISMAKEKRAVVMSEDAFRDYDFRGKRMGFPI